MRREQQEGQCTRSRDREEGEQETGLPRERRVQVANVSNALMI